MQLFKIIQPPTPNRFIGKSNGKIKMNSFALSLLLCLNPFKICLVGLEGDHCCKQTKESLRVPAPDEWAENPQGCWQKLCCFSVAL